MRPWHATRWAITLIALAGAGILTTGCSDDDKSPVEPPNGAVYDSITVDASAGWAAIKLGEPATPVTVTGDLSSSADWDIAFNATSVMLNGGDAGPGDVAGYCICQNANATDNEVTQMTDASELADFANVTDAQIPTDADAWQADASALAIDGWYNYDMNTHEVSAAPEKVWIIRTASGTAFAKFHVTNIADGKATFEYAVAPASDQPIGTVHSAEVTLTDDGSAVYFDFETGTVSTTADPTQWDIAFIGYAIHVNSGVSGTAQAGAVQDDDSFESLTSVDGIPSSAFKVDGFGGVFVASPWYRYNLLGNHHIWPTFNVYLIKSGSAVYKIQLTNYYSVSGDPRRITVRYAKLAG
jgi:hypothetical protein